MNPLFSLWMLFVLLLTLACASATTPVPTASPTPTPTPPPPATATPILQPTPPPTPALFQPENGERIIAISQLPDDEFWKDKQPFWLVGCHIARANMSGTQKLFNNNGFFVSTFPLAMVRGAWPLEMVDSLLGNDTAYCVAMHVQYVKSDEFCFGTFMTSFGSCPQEKAITIPEFRSVGSREDWTHEVSKADVPQYAALSASTVTPDPTLTPVSANSAAAFPTPATVPNNWQTFTLRDGLYSVSLPEDWNHLQSGVDEHGFMFQEEFGDISGERVVTILDLPALKENMVDGFVMRLKEGSAEREEFEWVSERSIAPNDSRYQMRYRGSMQDCPTLTYGRVVIADKRMVHLTVEMCSDVIAEARLASFAETVLEGLDYQ